MYVSSQPNATSPHKGLLFISAFVLSASASFYSAAVSAATQLLTVSSQPTSSAINVGQSKTFTISAISSRAIKYYWYKNGASIGINNKSYTITNATLSNAGSYSCKVTDGRSTYNCTSFSLTVNQPVSITQQPVSQTVNEGTSVSMKVAASGTGTISYQWYYNSAAISGATSSTLSIASAKVANTGNYYCNVRNSSSSANSSTAALTVQALIQPVSITQQPSNQIVNAGTSVSMSVGATGTGPLSYQWYFNGAAISGATSSTFSLPSAQVANTGNYYCNVRNSSSSANSSTVSLSVLAVVQTRSAYLSWTHPTTRSDGTTLSATDIAGYNLYHAAGSSTMTKIASLSAADLNYLVNDLGAGTHYFAASTVDINGTESARTPTTSVNIQF